jgi:hypothetical protein
VPTVLKSGNLNLLELYGSVQGCNGIALPLRSMYMFKFPTHTLALESVLSIQVEDSIDEDLIRSKTTSVIPFTKTGLEYKGYSW